MLQMSKLFRFNIFICLLGCNFHFKSVLFVGKKSADLMYCLQMQSCAVTVTRRKNNTCLCTNKMCAKIKCTVTHNDTDCARLTVTCKMKIINANDDDCFTYHTDNLTGKMTPWIRNTFMNHKPIRDQTKYEKASVLMKVWIIVKLTIKNISIANSNVPLLKNICKIWNVLYEI